MAMASTHREDRKRKRKRKNRGNKTKILSRLSKFTFVWPASRICSCLASLVTENGICILVPVLYYTTLLHCTALHYRPAVNPTVACTLDTGFYMCVFFFFAAAAGGGAAHVGGPS